MLFSSVEWSPDLALPVCHNGQSCVDGISRRGLASAVVFLGIHSVSFLGLCSWPVLFIALTISCPETPDVPQITKKLPDTMTVQKLKGLLQRLCHVAASDQQLSYASIKVGNMSGNNFHLSWSCSVCFRAGRSLTCLITWSSFPSTPSSQGTL